MERAKYGELSKIARGSISRGEIDLIILTTGGKMSAYGPGSRAGMMHDVFDITPVAEGLIVFTLGQTVTAEFILAP